MPTPQERLAQLRGNQDAPASVASKYNKRFRVGVIGSGNWGTAVAKIVAENCLEKPYLFHRDVKMWVREEEVSDMKLTDIINSYHENVKYLPEVTLPFNLFAEPDIRKVADGADLLVINLPHQFLGSVCDQMKGIDFSKSSAISCLKGINVSADGVELLHDVVEKKLGLHCGVLSGANIASEVARERWSETTIAFPLPSWYQQGDADENLIKELFYRPYFHVQVSDDVCGASISGALKNVVALGAGLVEGAGWGDNAKAAVMRRGLLEMIKFGNVFFPGKCRPETFTTESAGVADLITSCAGGRNVKVGRAFARTGKPLEVIEKELLNGQSAQGIITGREVMELLTATKKEDEFPLLGAIYDIVHNKLHISNLPERIAD
uniref:Glycerol-3-phosphate dehydrogenase [NAD(+)] n=1 Tax=Wickerhamiella versatilis TaxID=27304 RepID=A0A140JW77_WICVE|nr:glycerol-3-phosphate dehydrogenase [Wickerhamiella versatilis]